MPPRKLQHRASFAFPELTSLKLCQAEIMEGIASFFGIGSSRTEISDDEASDFGSEVESAPEPVQVKQEVKVKAEKKGRAKAKVEEPEPVEEESLMVESDKGDGEDEEDDIGEDEYVVEKITNHLVDPDTGVLKFEVKWEGYDKKSDRTWEPEENLETAAKILNEYLASVGGKEQIFAQWEEKKAEDAAKKSKKRGRASSGVDTPTNGAKKGRKSKGHPLNSTPPASNDHVGFKPPSGNWEEEVEGIDACEGADGKPIVYITWKDGNKSQHPLAQVYKRCPQKMLKFYEKHLVFKRNDPEE